VLLHIQLCFCNKYTCLPRECLSCPGIFTMPRPPLHPVHYSLNYTAIPAISHAIPVRAQNHGASSNCFRARFYVFWRFKHVMHPWAIADVQWLGESFRALLFMQRSTPSETWMTCVYHNELTANHIEHNNGDIYIVSYLFTYIARLYLSLIFGSLVELFSVPPLSFNYSNPSRHRSGKRV